MAGIMQGEQRRAVIIAMIGLGLVAVLLVGSRVFGGGDDDDVAEVAPTAPTTTQAGPPGTAPRPSPGPEDEEPEAEVPIPEVPDSFELVDLRNPFQSPILTALVRRFGTGAPGDGTGAPGDGTTGDPCEALANARLVLITEEEGVTVAELVISGESHRAAEGETFGPGGVYQVLSIDTEAERVELLCGDRRFVANMEEVVAK